MAISLGQGTNLTVGKGKVHFSRCLPDGSFEGFRFIGNAPTLNLTIEREVLEHFSSTGGIREKDAEVTLEVTRSGSVETDNINAENLAAFFFGETQTVTQAALTVTDESITSVVQGRIYQIGASAGNPTGARLLTDGTVVVTDATGTTTYVEGTDYELDLTNGLIEITVGGGITDGDDILVDYDAVASTREQVISGGEPITVAVLFIADNPVGANRTILMPNVNVTPDGDFSLIGEEFQVLSFSLELLTGDQGVALYIDDEAKA
jgi:hypothetical protein